MFLSCVCFHTEIIGIKTLIIPCQNKNNQFFLFKESNETLFYDLKRVQLLGYFSIVTSKSLPRLDSAQ